MWKKIFIIIIFLFGVAKISCDCPMKKNSIWHPPQRMGYQIARAAETGSVVINEIAWMGNDNSSADEWIELYNNTDAAADLAGWKIISQDGSPEILLEGKIFPKVFF